MRSRTLGEFRWREKVALILAVALCTGVAAWSFRIAADVGSGLLVIACVAFGAGAAAAIMVFRIPDPGWSRSELKRWRGLAIAIGFLGSVALRYVGDEILAPVLAALAGFLAVLFALGVRRLLREHRVGVGVASAELAAAEQEPSGG